MTELMLKGAAVAVTAALCAGVVRRGAPEIALVLSLAGMSSIARRLRSFASLDLEALSRMDPMTLPRRLLFSSL